MNCFEWQNHSSDHLDGTLIGTFKKEADKHLESCQNCNDRNKHYRQILSSIATQPRSTLPVPIRKSPLAIQLPKIDNPNRRSKWERTPWFVRTGVEGVGIAFVILFVVAMVPRIRALYERSIERRLDAFNMADLLMESEKEQPLAPLTRGKVVGAEGHEVVDDFAGSESDDSEDDEKPTQKKKNFPDVIVGNSEIWRFNLKTDSPRDVRPKIVQTLSELKLPSDTPGLGGIEAPGGIQFDLLVSQNSISGLRSQLQKLANTLPGSNRNHTSGTGPETSAAPNPGSDTFTWYKNKSKRQIPAGKARVVIWLSQM